MILYSTQKPIPNNFKSPHMIFIIMLLYGFLLLLTGTYQISTAVYRFFHKKSRYPNYKSLLGKYLILVILYIALGLLLWEADIRGNRPEVLRAMYFTILPWLFAAFYWRIMFHKEDLPEIIDSNLIDNSLTKNKS